MSTYKITNITNLVGKRDVKFNSTLDITYVDSMIVKTIKIKPEETIYLQISSLPLSVHRLRVKQLISVIEIADNELKRTMEAANKPQAVAKQTVIEDDKKIMASAPKKKIEVKPEIKKTSESLKKLNEDEDN